MGLADTETSRSLKQWNRGDEGALHALLERHLTWIHARVRQRMGPRLRRVMDSTDVVQEAAVQFLRYGPRIVVFEEDDFRHLMARIVENVLCDRHDWYTARRREIARQRPLPRDTVLYLAAGHGGGSTPSKIAEAHEREAWIRLGMELLDAGDRELIVLRQWEGLSFGEMGKKLGISPEAAGMRYRRAVGQLGKKVGALRRGNLGILREEKTA